MKDPGAPFETRCEMTGRAADEAEIVKVAARLAQASDDRDTAAYRRCLAGTICARASGNAKPVPADRYADAAMDRLRRTEWTHHRLSNPVVDVIPGADRAIASIDVVVELCRTDDWGARLRGTVGGRYRLGLVRSGAGWLIDRREFHRRYCYCTAPDLPV